MLKRAYIQIPYAVISRLLFENKGIGVYRVNDDHPGPNGYVEFIVYVTEHHDIERGGTYELHVSKKLKQKEE